MIRIIQLLLLPLFILATMVSCSSQSQSTVNMHLVPDGKGSAHQPTRILLTGDSLMESLGPQMVTAMKGYKNKKWQYLYDFAYRVFDFLSLKALIAEQLVPAYQNGDRDALAHIAHTLLPNLKKKTAAVHKAHKAVWMSKRNMLGWSNLDIRYGGMAARCDTATQLIHAYLEGKISAIESLEEQRLHKPLTAFPAFSKISSPNIKT
jgi:hypothetical protein